MWNFVFSSQSVTFNFEDFDIADMASASCANSYVLFYDATRNNPDRICDTNYAKYYSEPGVELSSTISHLLFAIFFRSHNQKFRTGSIQILFHRRFSSTL